MTLNITQFVSGNIGLIHLIASIGALLLGTIVLSIRKGTKFHRKIGYGYSVCMTVLLITAFMLYNLFGRWGIFHWTAVVSSITLLAGIVPMFIRSKNSVKLHISFMYWSVIGLYAAFASEILTRIPRSAFNAGIPTKTFYMMTSLGVALVMLAAAIFFIRTRPKWENQFSVNQKSK